MSNIDDIRKKFGEAIRGQRKKLHLSQEQLAEKSGLHRTYISDIEGGGRNVSLVNIEKLAQALKTEPYQLLKKIS